MEYYRYLCTDEPVSLLSELTFSVHDSIYGRTDDIDALAYCGDASSEWLDVVATLL